MDEEIRKPRGPSAEEHYYGSTKRRVHVVGEGIGEEFGDEVIEWRKKVGGGEVERVVESVGQQQLQTPRGNARSSWEWKRTGAGQRGEKRTVSLKKKRQTNYQERDEAKNWVSSIKG